MNRNLKLMTLALWALLAATVAYRVHTSAEPLGVVLAREIVR